MRKRLNHTLLTSLLLFIPFISGCHSSNNINSMEGNYNMDSDSKTWASKVTAGWNLGNSLEAFKDDPENSETAWWNPITTKSMIDSVAAAGFNAIRIPVRWYPHFTDTQNCKVDRKWMERVKTVVNYCLDNNLYVIINTHHEHWLDNKPFYKDSAEIYRKEAALWKEIATAFKDYDERLIFAGTNEVHVADYWGVPTEENLVVQNGFNRIFIETVRATGERNLYRNLIIQAYVTNIDQAVEHLVIPPDPTPKRLMIEVHYYDPYKYGLTDETKFWGQPYSQYGIDADGQEVDLEKRFAKLKSHFVNNGYPIILGECGANRHSTTDENLLPLIKESRAYYHEKVISIARKNGIVPFVWDNGYTSEGEDQFGLFDRKNGMTIIDRLTVEAIMKGTKTAYPF